MSVLATEPLERKPETPITPQPAHQPPIKRAAYSDRMAVLLAHMADLAYIPFEKPKDHVLDQVLEKVRAATDNKMARTILDEFYRNFRSGDQADARDELVGKLSSHGFDLIQTYAVGETQAFLAKMDLVGTDGQHEPGIMVLSFRGTEKKIADWKTDLKFRREPGMQVHGGFWKAFKLVRSEIQSDIEQWAAQGYTLYITGHSLGGALALIATHEIGSDSTGACYTFGQPRVAVYGFAQIIKTPLYRLVNANDIVPRMPLAVIPHVLLFATSLVRFPGRGLAVRFLNNLVGFVHHGDMRYLTRGKKEGADDFEDVKLLANPNIFDRACWWFRDLFANPGSPIQDHSMSLYLAKLGAYAQRRNK